MTKKKILKWARCPICNELQEQEKSRYFVCKFCKTGINLGTSAPINEFSKPMGIRAF